MISNKILMLIVTMISILHALLVLLQMINCVSKLLLPGKAVEGRLPMSMSFVPFLRLKSHTLGKAEEQETASPRVSHESLSHP